MPAIKTRKRTEKGRKSFRAVAKMEKCRGGWVLFPVAGAIFANGTVTVHSRYAPLRVARRPRA